MAKDLVCGMDLDEKTAKYTTTYKGKTYYFCAPESKKCSKKIRKSTLAARPEDTEAITAATAATAKRCVQC